MKSAALLLAACASSVSLSDPATGQVSKSAWWIVGRTGGDSGSIELMDGANVTIAAANARQAWIHTSFDRPQTRELEDGKSVVISHDKTLRHFDCVGGRTKLMMVVRYSSSGEPVQSDSIPSSNWVPVVPGSLGEALLRFACASPGERRANKDWIDLSSIGDPQVAANTMRAAIAGAMAKASSDAAKMAESGSAAAEAESADATAAAADAAAEGREVLRPPKS